MKIKGAFPVRWAAQDGQPGTGVTIVQTTTRYAKSMSGTTRPTSGWQTSVPDVPDGQYLWTWVYVRYSDGTETNAYSVARMGIDGRGILSSSVTYSQQATSVDPTTITNWGAFPSTLTDGYWLYTKTHIVYSDNESTDSYSVSQVGVGSYYAGCQEYWAKGSSDVTPPEGAPTAGTYVNGQTIPISGTWSQNRVQTTADEPYLWNFEVSADSMGNRYVTQAVCIGNFAKGIVSIVESYAISAHGSAESGRSYPSDIAAGDWTDEQNAEAPTEAKRYQWNRTVVTYNDDSTDTHYHVSAVKGIDGKGAVYIDLDNENDTMLYDGQGALVSGEVTSSIVLYANGAKVASPPTFSIKEKSSSVTAVIEMDSNNFQIVKVSAITSNAGYVIVQCTYNGVNYTARMTIKRLVGVDKYDIVLNHTAVTYNETKGTLSNASITLNIYRTAQNGTRTMVANTTALNTLKLTAKVYPNGVATNAEEITFSSSAVGTISLTAAKAYDWTNFAVVLFKNNVEIDRETIPINKVEDGAEGHGAIILDLDNENDVMLYDGAGNLKSGNVTSQGRLLDAGEDKTANVSTWALRNLKNLSGTISASGLITITGVSADSGSAIAVATYGGKEYTAQITIKKLVGVDKYEIVCIPNALTYNTTKGTGASQNVIVKIYRTGQNGTRSLVAKLANYSLKLHYYFTNSSGTEFGPNNIADGTSSTSYNNGVTRPLSANTYTQYRFELLDANDQVLDVETVPISKTSDGDAGSDSILVDLDNENDSILYDGADSPISDPVISNASLYKGPNKVTSGITWSLVPADCSGVNCMNGGDATSSSYNRTTYPTAAWITSGGVVTVNGISGSQAVVVVMATYNSKNYMSKLTIKKLRGIDKYDLVISPAALTYNTSTGLVNGISKAQVTVQIWRTAQNGTRTMIDDFNGTNKFGLSIDISPTITETSTQTYGKSFLVSSSVANANSNINITLKTGAQTLDSETVPIAKTSNGSGSAGPGAKSIYATAFDKPATPTGATPWTIDGGIWKENPVEDTLIPITQQGDWIKEEDGYMRAPAIGSNQSTTQTIQFITTESNQVIHIRAKSSTSSYAKLYIGKVDNTQPTASGNYERVISGTSQDTGDIALTIANAGQHFICICYTRGGNYAADLYAKFIVGQRPIWRSDAKTYNSAGAIATWTTPVKVSGYGTEQATQMRANLILQSSFLATRMDQWVKKNGATTNGLDGRNGYKGVPDYTTAYKELLAQNIFDPNGDQRLLANTWYTLSFWAKADPYIQINMYETSTAYGFARVQPIYFEAGVQNTIWVNGYVSSAALNANKSLRVFVYGDGEHEGWGFTIASVNITATASTTASATFTVPTTGWYHIRAYVYLEPSGGNNEVSGHTATVNWYRIDRGMRLMTCLWPTGGTQSTYTAIDTSAGRIKDGEFISNSSSPTDNNAEWKLTEVWTRHTLTFKTSSSIPSSIQQMLFRMHQASNNVYVCMPKLEQGTIATSFCTNDNDVADRAADETGFPNPRGIWVEAPEDPFEWNETRRDYVYYEINGEWRAFFVKRKGMVVPDGIAPVSGGNSYWEQGNVVSTLLSNTIIGTNCNIGGFLASNQVFKSQNGKLILNGLLGIIQMFHDDGYTWQVLEDGRQVLGSYTSDTDKGQHIQIDPSTKEIRIYDDDGSCVTRINGETISTIADLFGNTSGNLTLGTWKTGSASASNDGTNTINNYSTATRKVCDFQTDSATRLKFNGSLSAMGSRTWVAAGSTSTDKPSIFVPGIVENGKYSIDNWANVTIQIKTYSDANMTSLQTTKTVAIANSQRSSTGYGTHSVSMNNLVIDLSAGYHTLEVYYYAIVYAGQTTITSVSCSWSITSVSYVSDTYISRLFANGMAYGSSANNFFTAMNVDGSMVLKAVTRRYNAENNGFELSQRGMSIVCGDSLLRPVITLGFGRVKCTQSGNTYTDTLEAFSTCIRNHVTSPSVYRYTENDRAYHRINFPSEWTDLGLSANDLYVNAVAYYDAKDHNHTCSVKTITATYCEIVIGDDTSPNDLMNFWFEVKYMLP